MRKHVRKVLEPAVARVRDAGEPHCTVGTSKTFRSLARICGAAPYAMGPYVPRTMHLEDLRLWTRRMEAMTVAERAELPGVSAARAAQILAGAVVAEAAMDAYGVESLQICPWALREGLILRRLDQLNSHSDVRTVDPRHLVGAA